MRFLNSAWLLLLATTAIATVRIESLDGSTAVLLDANGIVSISSMGTELPSLGGRTSLASMPQPVSTTTECAEVAGSASLSEGIGSIVVSRQFDCTSPNASVLVEDIFSPGEASVMWRTQITTSGTEEPFSIPLGGGIDLQNRTGDSVRFWTAWTKGCVQNNNQQHGMCLHNYDKPWDNPLSTEALPSAEVLYRYGQNGGWYGSTPTRDAISLPIVSLLVDGERGLSLALSPEDPLLELLLHVGASGVSFSRHFLRLSVAKPVRFEAHLVGHAACWRPGLAFMTQRFASYFAPWVDNVAEFEGLASYSWNRKPYNKSRAESIGFKTNWDLSGTWMPYDGLFLPYQDKWENLGPINDGLAQYNVTYKMIDDTYRAIQELGFHSLSYFDIGNWGVSIKLPYSGPSLFCGTRPNGYKAPCPTPQGSSSYLADMLADAVLQHGWSVLKGFWSVPLHDWVGTTDMDTMEPFFEDLIVEQLQRHFDLIPTFEGIAIDRLDYSEFFNLNADDNISWVPHDASGSWGPARALRLSYRHTFARLHDVLHTGDKRGVMMNNCNTVCRLDEMWAFDGTFSEGAALNAVAWTGLRQPTILWTYDLAPDLGILDTYFQQHLLMNVYPMAPMPRNDHSIVPGDNVVEGAYEDYGPLFTAMRGARWVLTANPVTVTGVTWLTRVDSPPQPVRLGFCSDSRKIWQQWSILKDSSANTSIVLTSSAACLNVWKCGCGDSCGCTDTIDGALVDVYQCHPQDKNPLEQNQVWIVKPDGSLMEARGGRCLTSHDSELVISQCDGSVAQQWQLQPDGSIAQQLPSGNGTLMCLDAGPTPPKWLALANAFDMASGALLVPVVLADHDVASVDVTVRVPTMTDGKLYRISALWPGRKDFVAVTTVRAMNGMVSMSVPVRRGGALVFIEEEAVSVDFHV